MTNVVWRRYYVQASILIAQIRQHKIPRQLSEELARIETLIKDPDYIGCTPKVYSEAPELNLNCVDIEVKEKYEKIIELAKPFYTRSLTRS